MVKKKLISFLFLVSASACLFSCSPNDGKTVTQIIAEDGNANFYDITSSYAYRNDLHVTAIYSDNSRKEIDPNDYTYTIKDSGGREINPNYQFQNVGTYTVNVTANSNYGKKAASPIRLNVIEKFTRVRSITFLPNSNYVRVGNGKQLNTLVAPEDATYKGLSFFSSDETIATINEFGYITGLNEGTVQIEARAKDNSGVSQSCTVDVLPATTPATYEWTIVKSADELVCGDEIIFAQRNSGITASTFESTNSSSYLTSVTSMFTSDKNDIEELNNDTNVFIIDKQNDNFTFFTKDNHRLSSDGNKKLILSAESKRDQWKISFADVNAKIENTTYGYGTISLLNDKFSVSTNSILEFPQIYKKQFVLPLYPTALNISETSIELEQGSSHQLSFSYEPFNANSGRGVYWSSSNEYLATVDQTGKVNIKRDATPEATVDIFVTSKYDSSIYNKCTITIKKKEIAKWTILMYICGSNLESQGGFATTDISEMLYVKNQPDNINLVIETGGASINNKYFSSRLLNRYHIYQNTMVLDEQLTTASMGKASTLQSFMEWGIEEYPAEQYGFIFWNHGGAMRGVCSDELFGGDSLSNSEVNAAFNNTFNNLGLDSKFEFIGYDACLMSVQDVADFNSKYCKYMVCSEESEYASGWDYTSWIDDLYAYAPTVTILKAICDGFVGGAAYYSNQTLAVLDLCKMEEYRTAFEEFAAQMSKKVTPSMSSAFNNYVCNSVKKFADDSDSTYKYYGVFDAQDFLEKIKSKSAYSPDASYVDEALEKLSEVIIYSKKGAYAGNAHGLGLFWACSSACYIDYYYTSSETHFSNWRAFNKAIGY